MLAVFITLAALCYFQLVPLGDYGGSIVSGRGAAAIAKMLSLPLLWTMFFLILWVRGAVLVAVLSCLFFLSWVFAETVTFGTLPFTTLVAYAALSFALALSLLILARIKNAHLRFFGVLTVAVVVVVALVIPAVYITYYFSAGVPINQDGLFAIFQTNLDEAWQFVSGFVSFRYLVAVLIVIATIAALICLAATPRIQGVRPTLALLTICVLVVFPSAGTNVLKVLSQPVHAAMEYHEELVEFRDLQQRRSRGQAPLDAAKKGRGETYVVVIGESLSRRHMGLYGYFRDTTPRLSALAGSGEVIVYENAFSNHTHTIHVLSQALTESNQFNGKGYFKSASLVDLARATGFETYWFSNQNMMGPWDNLVSIIAHGADALVGINKMIGPTADATTFDGELVPLVESVLDSDTGGENRILFVHLMGSHEDYCAHTPPEFGVYADAARRRGDFGVRMMDDPVIWNSVNCYDDSVLYNDEVVSKLLGLLMRRPDEPSALVYFSDHADDVFGGVGHDSSRFTFAMTEIPLLFWTSSGYERRYPGKVRNIRAHRSRLFTNDLIYDTVAGMAGIRSNTTTPAYDLTSRQFHLDPQDALTLHGRQALLDDGNAAWWQPYNQALLDTLGQADRVVPRRVASIGALHDVWAAGFRSFEIRLVFDAASGTFVAGDGADDAADSVPFAAFLDSVDS
ncbi:phosphoethanolamine transferase [Castellaniella sp.]|uniref:phosphoethanolamine transferase n=1 Tax=Castellaniella sp. TaxID=1955812 RepID=UPI0035653DB6